MDKKFCAVSFDWREIACAILLVFSLFTVASCGEGSSGKNTGDAAQLELGSALLSVPLQERRIGIVYSEHTAQNFFGEIEYNQLYAAMQHHAVQAGLSFDLLHEEDLLDSESLKQYAALVFPLMSHVTGANKDAIVNSLLEARRAGVAFVASGDFIVSDENGVAIDDGRATMESVLGLFARRHMVAVPTTVKIGSSPHPITDSYESGEVLLDYPQAWYAEYEVTADANPAVIISLESTDDEGSVANYNGAYAFDFDSRMVHFSNPKIMADHDLLASAIEWAVYGNRAPVTLLPSRHDSVFLARNDMDQAMLANQLHRTEIPLLPLITDWKERFNFVGSYYIDVGDNPAIGQYTDWSVSGPLYRDYIALGSEIGTHSWTHPHYTSQLNNEELEFEFNQSRQEIGDNVGTPVIGGAVPGNPENMHVVENLNQWFEYFSGRSGIVDAGFLNATGYMEPQHQMRYFSLNMSPDFTLIDFLGYTPEQALDIWLEEFDTLTKKSRLPVLHWLWHDYGPTTSTEEGAYSVGMFEDTLAYAYEKGTEFVTLAGYHRRLDALEHARTSIALDDEIRVQIERETDVNGEFLSGLGQSALRVHESTSIARVVDWYAYDDAQVFVPEAGGDFRIITSDASASEPADVTRISALPMRAKLIDVQGNGNELSFSIEGEGEVEVTLSSAMIGNVVVQGASSITDNGATLTLNLDSRQIHTIGLSAIDPVNSAPTAQPQLNATEFATPVSLTLAGADPDNDTLQYMIVTPPANGMLTGTAPNFVYMPLGDFTGIDSFQYQVSDGSLSSLVENVEINVATARLTNMAPVAFASVYETLVDQPLLLQLNASDNESQTLGWNIISGPANGSLSGSAPALTYTPSSGFSGTDSFTFRAHDGGSSSEEATVTVHVSEVPTAVYGSVTNLLPAAPLIDGDLSDWGNTVLLGTDPADTGSADNPIDWKSARMGHTSSRFYLAYEMHSAQSPAWGHQVYIDTDGDINTGFRGFAGEFPIGADYLIEAATLLAYNGDNSDQKMWSWGEDRPLAIANQGAVVEMELIRAHLGQPEVLQMLFVGDNHAAGGTVIDRFPDAVANANALLSTRRLNYSVNPAADGSNSQPYALAQELSVSGSALLPVQLEGFDSDNDDLNVSIVSQPQNGVLQGFPPAVVYQANDGFTGEDSFSFVVDDGQLQSAVATVTLSVVSPPAVNHIPVAHSQSLSLSLAAANTLPIALTATDADPGPLDFQIEQAPVNGRLGGTAPNLVYTPDSGFSGTDVFSFFVSDGTSESERASVSILVEPAPINLPPTANSQSLSTAAETAVAISLTGSDAENASLTYSIVRAPALGLLSGTLPELTYQPFGAASGTDSFEFIVSDGQQDSQSAVVIINVQASEVTNTPPQASAVVSEVANTDQLPLELTATDADLDHLTYLLVNAPASGALSGLPPSLIYTPEPGFTGTVEFEYVANDGKTDSEPATVTITVSDGSPGEVSGANGLSNPGASIAIDGKLSDWAGLSIFPPDPNDVKGPGNRLDWLGFYAAHSHSNGKFYLAFRNQGGFTPSWGHSIFIDTDNNVNTGFRGFGSEYPLGADVLIENNSFHSYSGHGTDWSWSFVETGQVARKGAAQEMSFPLQLLANATQLRFFLIADNTAVGGTAFDFYPDLAPDSTVPLHDKVMIYQLNP